MRIVETARRVETRQAGRPAGHDDRPDRGAPTVEGERHVCDVVADETRRAPRVDAVRGEHHHTRPGRDTRACGTRPGIDARPCGQRGEHGADGALREIVGDLHGDGRLLLPSREGGSDGVEQGVALARGRAVHAGESAHFGARRAGHQRGDDDVDPRGHDGGGCHSGGAELHAAVVVPQRGSGGIEFDHRPIMSGAPTPDATVPSADTECAGGEERSITPHSPRGAAARAYAVTPGAVRGRHPSPHRDADEEPSVIRTPSRQSRPRTGTRPG
ncbi:hypothetical protein AS029_03990 [Microbacterium enclense]|nr:hypothetical protein AS029_03990 [Microbacterium enclense]